MNEEEKKAIEDFKECYEKDISRYEDFNTYTQYIVKRNELILNLIEKQSKEIESLKEDNKKKSIVIIEYQDLYEKLKDKIKAKIEESKKLIDDSQGCITEKELYKEYGKIELWQELLEDK